MMRAAPLLMPIARALSVREASRTGAASAGCVLLAGAAASVIAISGLDPGMVRVCFGTLTLLVMAAVPTLMSRVAGKHSVIASAATLIMTLSAMSTIPVYQERHIAPGVLIATLTLLLPISLALLFYGSGKIKRTRIVQNRLNAATASPTTPYPLLLAVLAGFSSGALARFQLFGLCAVNAGQSPWDMTVTIMAVCTVAYIAQHARNSNTLTGLYVIRSLLTIVLLVENTPPVIEIAARLFLILDCLTIPLLTTARREAGSVSTACPGIAHHMGMLAGATLSTMPYFFGVGFTALYAASATATTLCAAMVITKQTRSTRMDPTDEHAVRVGMNDCLVTEVNCARAHR